ncbi:MAG: DUF5320 domain-containing protein [Candidatus Hinthialibacter antarcticus]|nr:DUF5320 domain-containing protein [Candidatus Hinthialibacter antarcticus]
MPGKDRSGPSGMGPATGRGFGLCTGTVSNVSTGRGGVPFRVGRSVGRRRGSRASNSFGRGRRQGNFSLDVAAFDRNQDLAALKEQAEQVQLLLDNINQRIEKLEAPPSNEPSSLEP